MAPNSLSPYESQAMNKPPYFDGSNYKNWKVKMKIFLQCIDLDILKVVLKPFTIPELPYDDTTRPLMALNVKAINAFHYCLSPSEFERISMCSTAHEIWSTLEIEHEGTDQVRESRINRLMHEYEIFHMNDDEPIDDMFSRFNKIVGELFNLGKCFTDKEKNYKLLRSLTSAWQPKITAIEEAQDLSKLKFAELIGRLRTHEMQLVDMKKRRGEEVEAKKKGIALQANQEEPSSSSSSSSDSDSDKDDEVAHFARKFKKLMKSRRSYKGKPKHFKKSRSNEPICFGCNKIGHIKPNCPLSKKEKPKQNEAYKGKEKFKKKALAATWDDSSSSEEECNEKANMCFMAHEDEIEVSDYDNDDYIDFENIPRNELLDEFLSLQETFGELFTKYKKLKKKHMRAKDQLEYQSSSSTSCICDQLKDQVEELQLELAIMNVEHGNSLDKMAELDLSLNITKDVFKTTYCLLLTHSIEYIQKLEDDVKNKDALLVKFTNSTKTLSTMLGDYGVGPKRFGIGYSGSTSQAPSSSHTISFVRPSNYRAKHRFQFITCNYCLKMGHTMSYCMLKKNASYKYHFVPNMNKGKHIDVAQTHIASTSTSHTTHASTSHASYRTNTRGPKFIWVPKIKN